MSRKKLSKKIIAEKNLLIAFVVIVFIIALSTYRAPQPEQPKNNCAIGAIYSDINSCYCPTDVMEFGHPAAEWREIIACNPAGNETCVPLWRCLYLT
jgi:hypothetical protein